MTMRSWCVAGRQGRGGAGTQPSGARSNQGMCVPPVPAWRRNRVGPVGRAEEGKCGLLLYCCTAVLLC